MSDGSRGLMGAYLGVSYGMVVVAAMGRWHIQGFYAGV